MSIIPGRKIFPLILLLFSILIISLKTYITTILFVFYFILSFAILDLIWLLINYKLASLQISREIPAKLEEGDTLIFETIIVNKGKLALSNLVIREDLPFAEKKDSIKTILVDHLEADSTVKIRLECNCSKRGKYELRHVFLYFYDFFGLYCFTRKLGVYSEIYVYPKPFIIKKFPELKRGVSPWFGIETTHTSGEDDEFYGLREYKEGDPVKNIHWISTLRNNKLIVKQFQRQSYFRATLIFNLESGKNFGKERDTVMEYMIKIAASVARYLICKNISVEIIAHSRDFVYMPFNKGMEHLENIMRFLAVAEPESKVSLGEMFQDYSAYISDNSSLICIMLDKDWEYLPQMLPLSKRNVLLLPIILMSHTFIKDFEREDMLMDAKQKVADTFDVKPIIVSQGDNLEELFSK